MAGACTGIRVLECTRGAAGSLATMVFADFGADVIRLEQTREDTEVTPADLLLNRGKRSVSSTAPTALSAGNSWIWCPPLTCWSRTGRQKRPGAWDWRTKNWRPSTRAWSVVPSRASVPKGRSSTPRPTMRWSWPRRASSATSPAGNRATNDLSTARSRRDLFRRDAHRPRRPGRPPGP